VAYKLVSFDVWDTLLRLDTMLEAIAEGISRVSGVDIEKCMAIVYGVREKIREYRRLGSLSVYELISLSRELIAEHLGVDLEIVYRGIARGVLDVEVEELVYSDARDTLKKIKEKGVRVIVLANVMIWPSPYTRLLLEKTGLSNYIDRQYYADEIGYYKPLKEAFYKPLRDYGVEPCDAVHVGDSVVEDYNGALEAGLTAIRVDRGMDGVVKKCDRGYIVSSLKHVVDIVFQE